MSPTQYANSNCHNYLDALKNTHLLSLKKINLKSLFLNLKDLIPIDINSDLIIQQPVRIFTQVSAKRIQCIGSPFDNL